MKDKGPTAKDPVDWIVSWQKLELLDEGCDVLVRGLAACPLWEKGLLQNVLSMLWCWCGPA